jgi:hypothetical protein
VTARWRLPPSSSPRTGCAGGRGARGFPAAKAGLKKFQVIRQVDKTPCLDRPSSPRRSTALRSGRLITDQDRSRRNEQERPGLPDAVAFCTMTDSNPEHNRLSPGSAPDQSFQLMTKSVDSTTIDTASPRKPTNSVKLTRLLLPRAVCRPSDVLVPGSTVLFTRRA